MTYVLSYISIFISILSLLVSIHTITSRLKRRQEHDRRSPVFYIDDNR